MKIESIQPEFSFTDNGNERVVVLETRNEINSAEDVLQELKVKINLDEWALDHFKVGVSHAWRKDRSVEYHSHGGIIDADVHDTGGILDHPLRTLQAWLKRRTKEIRTRLVVDDLKRDMQAFAPKYSKINYPKLKDGLLYEIALPDIHFGRLAWGKETGQDSDLKIQTARVMTTLEKLLAYSKNYPIGKIVLPIGNDFFNSDNQKNETTAGTSMSEDSRWRMTYHKGRILAVTMVDLCSQIAPVDVIHVPGNHSEEREWSLVDAIECWFHNNPNVHVDNSPKKRKYYAHGQVLLGLTHGSEEKLGQLPLLMPLEVPELWAASKYREWHIGHLHHHRDLWAMASEQNGMMVRILRSLAVPDDWHYDKGLVGAQQGAEAFLWDKECGLVGQFTAVP